MKKLLLLAILFPLVVSTFAIGPLTIGLKAGASRSTFASDLNSIIADAQGIATSTSLDNLDDLGITNFHGGAFVRVSLGNIYIQPEAYFNTKGGEFGLPDSENDYEGILNTANQIEYNTIDVPVLLGFYVIDKSLLKVRVNAGPLFSYKTGDNFEEYYNKVIEPGDTETSYHNIKDQMLGWQAGIGADIAFLTIDARYESGANIFEGDAYSARSNVFLVSLGFKIF